MPLSSRHSAALLSSLFGRSIRALPDDLRSRIVEQSGGNPLFIEEMVRMLIADAVLRREAGGWVYSPRSGEVSVPLTIHGLLLGRIDRLPAPARQVLQEAAVIGPTFSAALLRRVSTDPSALPRSLEALVGAGLIALQAAPEGAA